METLDHDEELVLGAEKLDEDIEQNMALVQVDPMPVICEKPILVEEPEKKSEDVQVCEVEGEVDPNLCVSDEYMVDLPSSDCAGDIIPTPPLAPEVNLRFNQRIAPMGQEMMQVRAANQARKRNLEDFLNFSLSAMSRTAPWMGCYLRISLPSFVEGLQQPEDAKRLRSRAEAM